MDSICKRRVMINTRGILFETYLQTLHRFPRSLLGSEKTRSLHYCSQTKQHFFNRNPSCFEAILYCYQSNGTLHCPMGIPVALFEEECKYFKIPQDIINKMKTKEGIIWDLDDAECKFDGRFHFQARMWNFLDNPSTSCAAWIFGMLSISVIWISIITCCLETMPYFQSSSNIWSKLEFAVNVWFLAELILRFACSGDKLKFLRSSMNIVDIVAVIPYFLLLIVKTNLVRLVGIFKTLKFMRVFRLFRLTKHSRRLKVIVRILLLSIANFKVLMLCLLMLVFLGGSFMYIIEHESQHTDFTTIPASLWWSAITITSVGYGDILPTTIPGRLFACCYMMFGVLTISLPVLTIVLQFTELYPKNIDCEHYLKVNNKQQQDEATAKTVHNKPNVVGLRR